MDGGFLERARREALRYGSDPLVFVRELLQNARDAGASAVELRAEERSGRALLTCRDDGAGMSFDHARQYLFALYASSKEGDRGAAGRFGVGFWAILRFEPARIVVRSWPKVGEPWEVELDGELRRAERRAPPARRGHGTEVILERPARDGELARRVRDAAFQSGRFLRRRDQRDEPLRVRVNGEALAAPFELPPPSASFRRGRVRGAVGLGREARVELFARGLRVRSASAVEDLLAPDGSWDHTRVRFPTLADGIAPQAILDGEDLEPLLARADVRANRALRRLVALAQGELRRLIERQLEAVRPRSRVKLVARAALATLVVAAALGGVWRLRTATVEPPAVADGAASTQGTAGTRPGVALQAPARRGAPAAPASRPALPYRDLATSYGGPQADALEGEETPVALRYSPPRVPLHFAILLLERALEGPPPLVGGKAYEGPMCRENCVEIAVAVADGPGPLRLPRPTGQRVSPGSVRIGGEALEVREAPAGEPYVVLARATRGVLRYRTGPAIEPAGGGWAVSPTSGPLAREAARLRGRPLHVRVNEAIDWVRGRIAYSTTAETAARHARAARTGQDVLTRALAIGAGDCDVQNGVLATLLQAAGLRARLAIGYLGREGLARAPIHAWVEVREDTGPWRVADASPLTAPARPGSFQSTVAELEALETSVVATAAADPAVAVTGREGAVAHPARAFAWLGPALGGLATLGALGLVGLWLARPQRRIRLAPEQELAPLLQGALQRPEAFRHVPSLFTRRLVPTLSERPVSLDEAWDLARTRRLFRSAGRSTLARQAAAQGAVVLDTACAEARVVADGLGATDLDEWDVFLARCRRTPLLAAVDRQLRRLGEVWQVRAASGLGAPAVLDLPAGRHLARIVVVDLDDPWLAAASASFPRFPHEAVFAVVERLAAEVSVPAEARRFILRTLAQEALREAAP